MSAQREGVIRYTEPPTDRTPPSQRRTPRSGDDLFWFHEAKKAHAEAARLKAELHTATGLWYGACAARTEMRIAMLDAQHELALLKIRYGEAGAAS